jgi:hypothetical protein
LGTLKACGNEGVFRGILTISCKRVVLVEKYDIFVALIHIFSKNIYIFGGLLTLFGELYVMGNLRRFSAKTVLGIVLLNSRLFRRFFQFGLATLRGTKKGRTQDQ